MIASSQVEPGQNLGRYHIVRLIGMGGMGAVYEAFHPILKKRFAIKTLRQAAAQIPEAGARFLREAEAAARIDHPNVVRVTDVGSDGQTPYLVMEYLDGRTLAELLAERGRLEIVEALDILLPVLSAVAAAHALGVIHRDLKPENIFLAQDARGEVRPKVVDFGVSKLMDGGSSPTLTGPQAVLGTAAYMSPEQARGACEAEPSSDQYALGLILYEMLAGTRAQPGQNALEILHNISRLSIVRLRHHRPDCPQALEDMVMRMLSPTPEYRFPSLHDAGSALLAFAGEKTSRVLASTFGQPARPAPRLVRFGLSAERDDLTTQSSGTDSRRRVLVLVTGLVLATLAGWLLARQVARQASPPPAPAAARRPDRPAAAPPDLAVAATAAASSVPLEPEHRHDSRRAKASAFPRASKVPEKVFDRRQGVSPRPRRGVNDALIIE